jgi:DNA-binding LacI/PurR family transcriptional regulator
MASIQDVAKAAGVSKSTVSRCINDSPTISQATKDRVMEIVKQLGYVPNVMAKSLSSNNSYNITLLVDDDDPQSFQNPFFYEVMHGIEKIIYKNNYSLVVANVRHIEKEQDLITWLVKTKRTEGIILPSSIAVDSMIQKLKKERMPYVVLGDPDSLKETSSWVDVNNRKGGEQATLRLIEAGYKNIAFIGYDEAKVFSKQRLEGYKKVIDNYGLKVNVQKGLGNKVDGYNIVKDLLKQKDNVDAIICSNELMSIGALRAIQEANLKVPQDIGLISFDNDQIAELAYPQISTVNIDVFELGVQSAKLLFDMIKEDKDDFNQQVMISTTIKERETIK